MLYVASGEKFLEIENVTKKPAIEFLYFMDFYSKKSQLEQERINRTYNK
jgi:hypothetical protein